MSATEALQWLTLLAYAALAGVCIGVIIRRPRLRPLAWAWLAVAVNHVLLYAVAFLFLESRVGPNTTLIWSAASRIHAGFTATWMLVLIAKGKI